MNAGCTWVVVADGGQLRCFEEQRRGAALVERSEFNMRADDRDDVEFGERPGRVHESHAPTRHGVGGGEKASKERRARFLKRASLMIAKAADEGLYDAIVIMAPAQALGLLRQDLSDSVRAKIETDCDVDACEDTADRVRARLDALRHPAS